MEEAGCHELVLLRRHNTEYRHQSVALLVRMSVQVVSGDGDGEGDGVDGDVGDRNEEWWGIETTLSTVEKGHLYVLRPLFDLCFVLLASALATPYVSLCLSLTLTIRSVPSLRAGLRGDRKAGKGQRRTKSSVDSAIEVEAQTSTN